MKKENLLVKPDFGYDTIHIIIAYIIFGFAILGLWKFIELINYII